MNSDSYCDTNSGKPLSTNMFAYCENEPVSRIDGSGTSSSSRSSVYNRKNALKYAKKNYNRTKGTKSFRYYEGEDCANFVSQCLLAGGIKMNSKWYFYLIPVGKDDYTHTWTLVPKQYKYFKTSGFTKYVISFKKKPTKTQLKEKIKKYNIRGDLLYMDYEGDGKINHATMITKHNNYKDLLYTGHTNGAYDKSLLGRYKKYPNMSIRIVVLV